MYVKEKISIVVEGIVVTLVFLLASGSMVEGYNQVFAYKGSHHSYHHHGYRHYGGHPDGWGHSGPDGNQDNEGPSYYGHRNYGRSGPISWLPKSPIFCHGNPIVCHPSTPISPVSPITPVIPVISHPGGANGPIISHPASPGSPISPASPIGSGGG